MLIIRWQVQDYTGSYLVKLISCVVDIGTAYSADVTCTPQEPLTFQLDIELQQVSDPVSEVFSLNTELTLTRNKRAWLTNNRTGEVRAKVFKLQQPDANQVFNILSGQIHLH